MYGYSPTSCGEALIPNGNKAAQFSFGLFELPTVNRKGNQQACKPMRCRNQHYFILKSISTLRSMNLKLRVIKSSPLGMIPQSYPLMHIESLGIFVSCGWKCVSKKIDVSIYRKTSNTRRTKWHNLNDSRLVLQLSLPNPLKPLIMSRMKMQLEQRRQAMLQLHLRDQQFYWLHRCVLY